MPEEQSVDQQILDRLQQIDQRQAVFDGRQASIARDLNTHVGICQQCQGTIARLVKSMEGNDGAGIKQRVATLETRQQEDSDKIRTLQEQPSNSGDVLQLPSKWVIGVVVAIISALGGAVATVLNAVLN